MREEFRTKHRYLAAYLLSKNYPLKEWVSDADRTEFVFGGGSEAIEPHVQAFYSNTGLMRPQDFIRGLETVKDIIRAAKGYEAKEER